MSADRETKFRSLLRWFPKAWRVEWEDIALGSLLDDADRRQEQALSRSEAWGLRGHGLVERVATSVRLLAVAALVVAAVGAMTYFLVLQVPSVSWLGPLCASFIAPVLIAAVLAAHGYRAGLLAVRGTLGSLTVGALALACGYLAGRSWSVGFDEADAGRPQSWFAAGSVPLALAGLALGTAALLPLAAGVLRAVSSRVARVLLAVLIAAVSAGAVGAAMVMPTSAALAAATLVVLTFRFTAPSASAHVQKEFPMRKPATLWSHRQRTVLAGVTAACGTASAVFAFTGSTWPWYHGDGTQAMNLGLALACLSALPLLAALGNRLRTRPRFQRSLAPTTMLGALLAMAVAQSIGAGSSSQLTFLLIAGGLTGLTTSLLALPFLPRHPAARAGLLTGLTAATFTTIGLPAAVAAPIAAPIAAIVMLLITALRRSHTEDPASGIASA